MSALPRGRWIDWFPIALLLAIVTAFLAISQWQTSLAPCKRSETRSVQTLGSRYLPSTVKTYEVCVER